MNTVIWHNPRCSKSRQTLALLEEKSVHLTVRKYLEDAPSAEEIKDVLAMLDMDPRQLIRTGEPLYKELGLATISAPEKLIHAMVDNPKLIERPVVIHNGKAKVGRPPESVLILF
ncbi:arsenate reductase (glutaredoxin) [Cohaesibacter celericrescens]|uniref:Arsenate reductase n=2 Tax=Cohaesibacter celericrescens TaxID=2067669 RepID=A0A2N5XKA2_9HYPH|nr:arsenate reductase (glutaredoxin) [Cohaesibacter celericrescens]PLW74868.1 arsenate reductase (glutaredoxin) [Cohaesibacter celericrescens]